MTDKPVLDGTGLHRDGPTVKAGAEALREPVGCIDRFHQKYADAKTHNIASLIEKGWTAVYLSQPKQPARCRDCDGYNCDDGCAYPDAQPEQPALGAENAGLVSARELAAKAVASTVNVRIPGSPDVAALQAENERLTREREEIDAHKPHFHMPSYMHMGDCAICGNVADSLNHIKNADWKARAEASEAREADMCEALAKIERIYWAEGKPAAWRAAKMQAVVQAALSRLEPGERK